MRKRHVLGVCALTLLATSGAVLLLRAEEPAPDARFVRFRAEQLEKGLDIGYAVTLADVNGDGKSDIVVVDSNRVVWYENPTWKRRTMIQGGTKPHNVCIAAHDIDGDGKVDFALGAGWRPFDTQNGGTLQWLQRGKTLEEPWSIHPIDDREPMVHRIRFADIDGDGKPELISAPLMGRGSTAKGNWLDGVPVKVTAYRIPKAPAKDRWEPTVLDQGLHVIHNLWPINADKGSRKEILTASYEGVYRLAPRDGKWTRTQLGSGNQATPKGKRGASEIKMGTLKSGRKFIATIEPWHGTQVVVYSEPAVAGELWKRHVLDEQLVWGHAVWCADLDGDGGDELIIGVRDDPGPKSTVKGRRGVRVYQALDKNGTSWRRQVIESGGIAVEDLVAGDLDGDGRVDLIAVGRQTHNMRIYWNQGTKE